MKASSLEPLPDEPPPHHTPPAAPAAQRALFGLARLARRLGWRLNLLLLLATFVTTTLFYPLYFTQPSLPFPSWMGFVPAILRHPLAFFASGLGYSIPVLLILGSHEMGHYLFCRYYGVDATLPFFIPSLPPFPFGTFGAVIRMRPPIPGRRALFDIGIAGPIAGFLVAVPILFYGIATAGIERTSGGAEFVFGDPLLVKGISFFLRGPLPEGASLVLNPPFLAGWFGLLVTAMNLFPVGQLDGGHVVHAVSTRLHRIVSRLSIVAMIALVSVLLLRGLTEQGGLSSDFARTIWILGAASTVLLHLFWKRLGRAPARVAILLLIAFAAGCFYRGVVTPWLIWTVVLIVLGRSPHPPVGGDDESVGALRTALAVGALSIFVLSFMPVPMEIVGG